MSIKNLGAAKHEPEPLPHARLALSVIGCAVSDIKADDALRQRSAARFLSGSREFYFWAHVLEQDSTWLLRGLHTQLRQDSPQAFERLSRLGVIRFCGHIPKGGYDVHDGATKQEPAPAPAV